MYGSVNMNVLLKWHKKSPLPYKFAFIALEANVSTSKERNLRYPSGGSQASHMTAQARRKLGSLGTSIGSLREMLNDPKVARDMYSYRFVFRFGFFVLLALKTNAIEGEI